jgi:hypothetical protein
VRTNNLLQKNEIEDTMRLNYEKALMSDEPKPASERARSRAPGKVRREASIRRSRTKKSRRERREMKWSSRH